MHRVHLSSHYLKILFGLVLASAPLEARALQPMDEFLAQARGHNFDARVQEATVEQRDWKVQAAIGRLLPTLSARGVYQRNQYEVEVKIPLPDGTFKSGVLTPADQLDGYLQVDVPI